MRHSYASLHLIIVIFFPFVVSFEGYFISFRASCGNDGFLVFNEHRKTILECLHAFLCFVYLFSQSLEPAIMEHKSVML